MTDIKLSPVAHANGRAIYKRRHVKPDGRDVLLYGYEPHSAPVVEGDELNMQAGGELRLHPLRGTWSIYAAARNKRTFKPGAASNPLAPSQPGKPLTEIPFQDFEVCVFENRFPGLHGAAGEPADVIAGVTKASARGACEVIVYSPDPVGSLATLGQARRRLIVETWVERYQTLYGAGHAYVLPFENRGEEVGATLHHPHGQIYAFPVVPALQASAATAFEEGYDLTGHLKDWEDEYAIAEAGGIMAFAPPFSRFPYEVWLSARRPVSGPWAFGEEERDGFAHLLGDVSARYDAFFGRATPYMLSLQASPFGRDDAFQFTAQFYPLLRAPDRVKYLASVEQATGVFTVDVMPTQTAVALRAVR